MQVVALLKMDCQPKTEEMERKWGEKRIQAAKEDNTEEDGTTLPGHEQAAWWVSTMSSVQGYEDLTTSCTEQDSTKQFESLCP